MIFMNNTTKLTQRQLLDDRGILSAVMAQQDEKRKKKFTMKEPLNPEIFKSAPIELPKSLSDLDQDYVNPAIIDTAFMDAFRYNKNYEDIDLAGPRAPSHKQEMINERNRRLQSVMAKTYISKKQEDEGYYPFLDEIIFSPIKDETIKPKPIRIEPDPIQPVKLSRARIHSNERVDIKKEFDEFRKNITKKDFNKESILKKTYKYPLKQLKKRDTLLEHLAEIMENDNNE